MNARFSTRTDEYIFVPSCARSFVWLRLREQGSNASTRNCFDIPDVDTPAIALATEESHVPLLATPGR